jgi:hypothetical protein
MEKWGISKPPVLEFGYGIWEILIFQKAPCPTKMEKWAFTHDGHCAPQ